MFTTHSNFDGKLAASVQQDYQQAARNHRLVRESGYQGRRPVQFGVIATAILLFGIIIVQVAAF